jgi:hypothetical protein
MRAGIWENVRIGVVLSALVGAACAPEANEAEDQLASDVLADGATTDADAGTEPAADSGRDDTGAPPDGTGDADGGPDDSDAVSCEIQTCETSDECEAIGPGSSCEDGCCTPRAATGPCTRAGAACASADDSGNAFQCDTDLGVCRLRCTLSAAGEATENGCSVRSNTWCRDAGVIVAPIDPETGNPLNGLCLPGDCASQFNDVGEVATEVCAGVTPAGGEGPCGTDDCTCVAAGNSASFCVYAGTAEVGDPCGLAELGGPTCSAGLTCFESRCVQPCDRNQESDPCTRRAEECLNLIASAGNHKPGICAQPCTPYSVGECSNGLSCIPAVGSRGPTDWYCSLPIWEVAPWDERCSSRNPAFTACEERSVCSPVNSVQSACLQYCDPDNAGPGTAGSCFDSATLGEQICVRTSIPGIGLCKESCDPYPRHPTSSYPGCDDPGNTCYPFSQFEDRLSPLLGECKRDGEGSDTGEPCASVGFFGGNCTDAGYCLASRAGSDTGICRPMCEPFVSDAGCPEGLMCTPGFPLTGTIARSFCADPDQRAGLGDRCAEPGQTCADDSTVCLPTGSGSENECVKICRVGIVGDCPADRTCTAGGAGSTTPSYVGFCR